MIAKASDLRVGDVVRQTRYGKVSLAAPDGYIEFTDLKTGKYWGFNPAVATASFEVLKRAKRQYKVGDVLTLSELREHMWKRGTVIGHADDFAASGYPPSRFVLTHKGKWFSVNTGEKIPFDDISVPSGVKLHYLP